MKLFNFLKPDKNRVSIMLYVVLTVILSYISIKLLGFSTDIINWITNFLKRIYNWVYPATIGIIIAYLMYPIVNIIFYKITKWKKVNEKLAKFISILVAYSFILLLIVGFFYAIYISIGGQISNNTNLDQIINFISQFANTDSMDANAFRISALLEQSGIHVSYSVASKIAEFIIIFKQWFYSFISGIGTTLLSWSESLFSWGIGIILSLYLIKDAEYFLSLGRRIYYIIFGNSRLGRRIKIVLSVFDKTFKKYMKGQIIEAFFVTILSVALLAIFGIKYFLLIGIVSGVTNMIPYIGPILGTVLDVVMGLLDASLVNAGIGFLIMLVVQQIDNNIMAPKIVGGMVGLHPVFIIIALIIGGKFGGLAGMVLAVPIAASVKVLFNMWYIRTGKSDDWTIFSPISDDELEKEVDGEFSTKKKTTHRHIINLKSLLNFKKNENVVNNDEISTDTSDTSLNNKLNESNIDSDNNSNSGGN